MDRTKLTAFIYFLGRDKLPLGVIEEMMRELEKIPEGGVKFSNHYLAEYATDVVERLVNDGFDTKFKRKD